MPMNALRIIEKIHGHLGWLAVIALLHPAILLRNHQRRAMVSVFLATSVTTLVGVLGMLLYPSYRTLLRTAIFRTSIHYGFLFERKEHLAIAVLCLAWGGCVSHWFRHRTSNPSLTTAYATCAHWAFVAASVLALLVASFGSIVATLRSF